MPMVLQSRFLIHTLIEQSPIYSKRAIECTVIEHPIVRNFIVGKSVKFQDLSLKKSIDLNRHSITTFSAGHCKAE